MIATQRNTLIVFFCFISALHQTATCFAAPPKVEACSQVGAALKEAAKLRHLKLLRPVPCIALGPKAFQALVKEELLKDNPLSRVHYEGIAGKMLGSIPPGYDYERCVASDYGSDVLAFYHPEKHAIIFPNWETTPQEVLVHEAVHALQDQHFNLSALRDRANDTNDKSLAFSALAEGDAMYIQGLFNQNGSETSDALGSTLNRKADASCGLPEILRKEFEFAYDYGLLFVNSLRQASGEGRLNAAFKHPPGMTRDILYPKEFIAGRKRSKPMSTPRLSPELNRMGLKVRYREVLGEYFVRAFFRSLLTPEDGIKAGKGWDGDALALFEDASRKRHVLIWETAWENQQEAEQFRLIFKKALEKRYCVSLDSKAERIRFSAPGYPEINLEHSKLRVRYSVRDFP